jgi:hypothetical protein
MMRTFKVRYRVQKAVVIPLAILCFLSVALAQETSRRRDRSRVENAQVEKKQPFNPRDLSGVWRLESKVFITVENPMPPMTAWGKAKFDANRPSYGPRAVPPAEGNDPIGTCDPIGFPRNMFSPNRPVEFIQLPNKLVQLFQYHETWRTIWLDGRALPKPDDVSPMGPMWMGYSVGHWDGNTLVVETDGLKPDTWLDHGGDPHSLELRVEERYTRLKFDTIQYNMTLYDPKTYTGPIKIETSYWKMLPKTELQEEFCVPTTEGRFNQRIRDRAAGLKTEPGKQ